ncbi:MAG TPA: hypothetical protein VF624_14130 [Tepidisphaeraceae bacterium]|jgi:hypothetical protein
MMLLPTLLAKTTTDEVFKSIGSSLDEKINPNHILLVVVGVIILVVLISLLGRESTTATPKGKPKPLNNPRKLTRQVARQVGLSRRDLKRLNDLAAAAGVENPLALLLCPSALKAAAEKGAASGMRR